MTEFDAEDVISVGGWHASHARVIDVQVDGDVAAALIDANGDGADLNVDVYLRDGAGRWVVVASGNGSIKIPGVLATWAGRDKIVLTRTGSRAD